MNKGISLYFGYKDPDKEKVYRLISQAGFDCIITNFDERFFSQHGDMLEQVRLMKKYSLKPSSLHARYRVEQLPEFWKDSEIGDKMEREIEEDALNAKRFGFSCAVVHFFGEYSEVGEKRLLRILDYCKQIDLPLAAENIDDPKLFRTIFERIEHPFLKMCYDSGHNNYVDKETDYLSLYRDKIICLHLHDNMGVTDDHTLNRFGNINWREVARKIALLPNEVSLDYEMLMHRNHGVSMEDCVKETFEQACELEKMIEKFRRAQF